jgi:hypothetical protein
MMKRSLLALALTVQMTAMPLMAMAFNDIPQGYWADQAISRLSTQGIIGGYPGGIFKPEGSITRAEFSAILAKALGLQTTASGQSTFNDVPGSHWASPSIEAVKSSGLISGYPNGQFQPTRNISRAEAISVIVNASRMMLPSDEQANQILSNYTDQASIPAWARRQVAASIQNNLAAMPPSYGNRILPMASATRADVAAMTQNLRVALNMDPASSAGMAQAIPQQPQATSLPVVSQQPNTLQARIATVPTATKFTATVNAPITSNTSRVGDEVKLSLDQALMGDNGQMLIPGGSTVTGRVSKVEPAGRLSQVGQVEILFERISTPSGQNYPINARIATENGMLAGDSTKGRILKSLGSTALGAGAGAALGTAMGPLSGGKVGKGAIYGTAVGAGVGALGAAAMKGKEVQLVSGDKLEIQLTSPITVEQ